MITFGIAFFPYAVSTAVSRLVVHLIHVAMGIPDLPDEIGTTASPPSFQPPASGNGTGSGGENGTNASIINGTIINGTIINDTEISIFGYAGGNAIIDNFLQWT